MAELIKKQDAIDAVLKAHCYGTDIMEALQNLPTVTKSEIRAKAIDEFAECLSLGISESLIWGMLPVDCKEGVSDEIVEYVLNAIKVVAEQLKGE